MKEHIGEIVKLHIDRNGSDLFYTAKILPGTDTHISFIDKYKIPYTYRLQDVVSINGDKCG